MSLGAHLDELRYRLWLALLGFVAAFFIALAGGKWFARLVFSPYRAALKAAGLEAPLQAIQPAEPFLVYLKASLVLAALLASPWIFYQIWAFIAAGLHSSERRFVRRAAPASAALFAGGVLFFLLGLAPWMFRFLMQFDLGLDYLVYQPSAGRTLDFILVLALVFGLAFQTPLAIVVAERMGLVTVAAMQRSRRYVFLGAFVVGAVATPPDALSQIALALPLYGLYELALLICRLWPARASTAPPSDTNAGPTGAGVDQSA
jgi:sec-independent protein translocase protein TatC